MGCAKSVPVVKADPVERIPKPEDLRQPLQQLPESVPTFSSKTASASDGNSHATLTNSKDPIQYILERTNKSAISGDAFRFKNIESNSTGGHDDWLLEDGIFVEPVPGPGLVRKHMERLSGLYQGKEGTPVGFWVCDVSRGVNHFKILKETPNYKGQARITITGKDVGDQGRLFASPFKGRSSVDLYIYAHVEFDLHTWLVNIRVNGSPKPHQEDVTPYRMRQANGITWILCQWDYDASKYQECVLILQTQTAGIGRFPKYQITMSPGMDPAFVGLLSTILDYFWGYRMKAASVNMF